MKKISMLLVSFMIFITSSVYTFPVSADSVTGRLLYTDISAYINHYPIPDILLLKSAIWNTMVST